MLSSEASAGASWKARVGKLTISRMLFVRANKDRRSAHIKIGSRLLGEKLKTEWTGRRGKQRGTRLSKLSPLKRRSGTRSDVKTGLLNDQRIRVRRLNPDVTRSKLESTSS